MKATCFCLFFLYVICSYAQVTNDDLDQTVNDFDEQQKVRTDEFDAYSDSAFADYEAYVAAKKAEYDAFCERVKATWGGDSVLESTPKIWVEYSEDYTVRNIVNFETGEVQVEVVIDDSKANDSTYVQGKLEEAVNQLLTSKGTTNEYPSQITPPVPILSTPVMEGLIDLSKYDSLAQPKDETIVVGDSSKSNSPPTPVISSKNNLLAKRSKKAPAPVVKNDTAPKPTVTKKSVATAIVEEKPKTTTRSTTSEGEKVVIYAIHLELSEEYLTNSATRYKPLITKYAKKYNVEEPLIYAIMEQESKFNQNAKSPANAYGLMQLVPTSGAIDAYNFVYNTNRKKPIEENFLLNPEHNIELGTAYLHILLNNYFGAVSAQESRRLCSIASYNTGAGNLSRAVTGNTNYKQAIPIINGWDYQRFYNHLRSNLPAKETQDYIMKVSRNLDKYSK